MKKFSIIFIVFWAMALAPSCSDFMDFDPPGEFTAAAVWADGALVEAYLMNTYQRTFWQGAFCEESMASASDEALFTHGREFRQTNEGSVTDGTAGYIGKGNANTNNDFRNWSGHRYQNLYTMARACNDILENIDKTEFTANIGVNKSHIKGETYFIRAWIYFCLTRAYGSVPVITQVTKLSDDFESFQVPRNTYTSCIDQVLSDLDQAATLLTGRTFANTPKGRATLAAVKALRVRVLTDAASDLRDQATATAKVSIYSSYADKDLIFYSKGTRTDRWNAVRTAAKDLMNDPMGHAVPTYGGNGLTVEAKAEQIFNYFLKDGSDHIFSRYLLFAKGEPGHSGTSFPIFNGPNGYRAWSGNTPTQDLVDAYQMADGTKFDWTNPAHKAAPYKDREPRFYATILHDGAKWLPRPNDFVGVDPVGIIQCGYYQLDPTAKDDKGEPILWAGLDTRENVSPGAESWNGSYTGYTFKKFMNIRNSDMRNSTDLVFPFLRLTEVYMKYIEASIELGDLGEAKIYLDQIRNNVGLPPVSATATQDELRKIYQNESRLEFVFEMQRFWDTRRWLIAESAHGLTSSAGLGINIIGMLKPGVAKQDRYAPDDTKWTLTYELRDLSSTERRSFPPKMYFMPIHQDEMQRNLQLKQNPGY